MSSPSLCAIVYTVRLVFADPNINGVILNNCMYTYVKSFGDDFCHMVSQLDVHWCTNFEKELPRDSLKYHPYAGVLVMLYREVCHRMESGKPMTKCDRDPKECYSEFYNVFGDSDEFGCDELMRDAILKGTEKCDCLTRIAKRFLGIKMEVFDTAHKECIFDNKDDTELLCSIDINSDVNCVTSALRLIIVDLMESHDIQVPILDIHTAISESYFFDYCTRSTQHSITKAAELLLCDHLNDIDFREELEENEDIVSTNSILLIPTICRIVNDLSCCTSSICNGSKRSPYCVGRFINVLSHIIGLDPRVSYILDHKSNEYTSSVVDEKYGKVYKREEILIAIVEYDCVPSGICTMNSFYSCLLGIREDDHLILNRMFNRLIEIETPGLDKVVESGKRTIVKSARK